MSAALFLVALAAATPSADVPEVAAPVSMAQRYRSEITDCSQHQSLVDRTPETTATTADQQPAAEIDPILCAAILAARNAACCATCRENNPFAIIIKCGWSGSCTRGACVCEPLYS